MCPHERAFIRTLRPYSSSGSLAGFSTAIASGSYTARSPFCSITYGRPKSCPNFGSSSTYASRRTA